MRVELTRVVPFPAGLLPPSPSGSRSPYQKRVIRYQQTIPTIALKLGLKVRVQMGLPCSPPLFITRPRWGGVVVYFPFATNRGVQSVRAFADWRSGAVSRCTRIFEDCRSALPLTLILYHIRAHLSRVLGEKYCTNIRHFSIKYLCNLYNTRKSARCAPQRAAKSKGLSAPERPFGI